MTTTVGNTVSEGTDDTVSSTGVLLGDNPNPIWLVAIDRVQLSMCIVGAIVNIMTVVTLHKNGTGFQSCVSRLKLLFLFLCCHVTVTACSIHREKLIHKKCCAHLNL